MNAAEISSVLDDIYHLLLFVELRLWLGDRVYVRNSRCRCKWSPVENVHGAPTRPLFGGIPINQSFCSLEQKNTLHLTSVFINSFSV